MLHQADPISGGRAVKPAVHVYNKRIISGQSFALFEKIAAAKSRPETEIADKRLAFPRQTPSIEPSYKTAPKEGKMAISPIAQGFLKIFRMQHVALTVRRPKHPCLAWCNLILLYENFSRLVPRDPNLSHHSSTKFSSRYLLTAGVLFWYYGVTN